MKFPKNSVHFETRQFSDGPQAVHFYRSFDSDIGAELWFQVGGTVVNGEWRSKNFQIPDSTLARIEANDEMVQIDMLDRAVHDIMLEEQRGEPSD